MIIVSICAPSACYSTSVWLLAAYRDRDRRLDTHAFGVLLDEQVDAGRVAAGGAGPVLIE
ncbi:hypothetical protein ABIB37_000409 [Agrococcus sp. UYP10]|uniref:hypothetical protein n=1 Tax=Agrococcus sp. UYP10 TaxID=1756355 RepID=UPI003396A7B0